MAANSGLLLLREIRISDGPTVGPICRAKLAMVCTGRPVLPASAEPNQSSSRSSARRMTASGMLSNCRLAANVARVLLG